MSAGGTGGHLFPAQTVARELVECEVLFVAGGLKNSSFFEKKDFNFEEIACATFSFKHPLKALKALKHIFKGVLQSRKILRAFKPDLVVGFGSFYTLPLLLAALFERIPFMLHEQNAIPGKVNRLLARWAKTTAITFPGSSERLKGKTQETQFPLKKPIQSDAWTYFGLQPDKLTLLVFGGSQGAAQLNDLILKMVQKEPLPPFQLLHFAGNNTSLAELERCYKALGIIHTVKAFEPHMELALSIADLAITRAGAATIAELIEWEVPALLIPFPHASEDHQTKNGEHFVKCVQGGSLFSERSLDSNRLASVICSYTENERMQKKKNIQHYKLRQTLIPLSHLIMEISHG